MEQGTPFTGGKKKGIPGLIDKTVSATYDDLMAIIEAKMELIKIDLTEKVALIGALLILLVIFMIGTAYFITSAALLVGELLGHPFLGYLAISLLFISTFIVLTRFRPDLLKNFIHKILLSANDHRK
jgi:hypothetical protein